MRVGFWLGADESILKLFKNVLLTYAESIENIDLERWVYYSEGKKLKWF